MKVARFSAGTGARYGIIDGDEIVVLTGDPMFNGFETTDERLPLADIKLLAPVIPRSDSIFKKSNTSNVEISGGLFL